ncbi:MAG: FkbM family methyltransferase [Candidatus Jorgensenbacteria bacterium]
MMSKIRTIFEAIRVLKNWPLYFADYLGLVRRPSAVFRLRSGVSFSIRPGTNDRTIFNEIWLSRSYTPLGFEIGEHDTVIDIGAHIGFFSVFAAMKAKKGKVFSFEPVPSNFGILEKNVELNGLDNVVPINKAVSSESGTREMILFGENAAGHSFAYAASPVKNRINVETVNLGEFIKGNGIRTVDFLKMDCECAEHEILSHCSPEALRVVRKISMEYHEMDTSRNLASLKLFLERAGFKVSVGAGGGNILYAERY